MQRKVIPLIIMLFVAALPGAGSKEIDPMIELNVRCVDDGQCRFHEGATLNIELELRNCGPEPVSLPMEYIRRRGPSVRVYDNHSDKFKSLRTGLVATAERENLKVLGAGQSMRFLFPIRPQEIGEFALRPVDVSLEFSINLKPGLKGEDANILRRRLRVLGAEESS